VVRVKMKDVLSHEHLIHCYAHQLNLVMKWACSTVKSVKRLLSTYEDFRPFLPLHRSI
jgi:hypothetical protein